MAAFIETQRAKMVVKTESDSIEIKGSGTIKIAEIGAGGKVAIEKTVFGDGTSRMKLIMSKEGAASLGLDVGLLKAHLGASGEQSVEVEFSFGSEKEMNQFGEELIRAATPTWNDPVSIDDVGRLLDSRMQSLGGSSQSGIDAGVEVPGIVNLSEEQRAKITVSHDVRDHQTTLSLVVDHTISGSLLGLGGEGASQTDVSFSLDANGRPTTLSIGTSASVAGGSSVDPGGLISLMSAGLAGPILKEEALVGGRTGVQMTFDLTDPTIASYAEQLVRDFVNDPSKADLARLAGVGTLTLTNSITTHTQDEMGLDLAVLKGSMVVASDTENTVSQVTFAPDGTIVRIK